MDNILIGFMTLGLVITFILYRKNNKKYQVQPVLQPPKVNKINVGKSYIKVHCMQKGAYKSYEMTFTGTFEIDSLNNSSWEENIITSQNKVSDWVRHGKFGTFGIYVNETNDVYVPIASVDFVEVRHEDFFIEAELKCQH